MQYTLSFIAAALTFAPTALALPSELSRRYELTCDGTLPSDGRVPQCPPTNAQRCYETDHSNISTYFWNVFVPVPNPNGADVLGAWKKAVAAACSMDEDDFKISQVEATGFMADFQSEYTCTTKHIYEATAQATAMTAGHATFLKCEGEEQDTYPN